jgi:hypothetical protein
MKVKLAILFCLFFLFSEALCAQTLLQTVKGRAIDKATQTSLPGATVFIENTDPIIGGSTDADGYFRFENVPVGRYNIVVSYVGYATATVPEVLVTSGKEVALSVELLESANKLDEVVVKSHANKAKPLNSMAFISARSFNVEEARRYAGGLDDPARLASAFAGVAMGGNMQDNAITVRGNSPKGVLWRVEGVEVPNPNHFSGANVAGGGFVSVISSQVLANSDFFTGAFPAEYGNALAGVFDIKLRTGNNEKREYAIQAGMMGIDFAAEGPFAKGKNASYLFNYRYSTFGLLTKLGAIPSEQTPIYQDLSFKMNFPTKKAGTFSVWGMGSIDELSDPEENDSSLWEMNWDRYTANWDEKFGAVGLGHKIIVGQRSYINTSIAASGNRKLLAQQRLGDELVLEDDMHLKSNTGKITLSSFINHKFNARHTNRTGVNVNSLFYHLDLNGTTNDIPGSYRNFVKENGKSYHVQAYSQSKYDISDRFSVQAGFHAEYFALNQSFTIDPRIGFNWEFSPKHSFNFGYGKHSQLEDLNIYFINYAENGATHYPNKELAFSHAHHLVLGYDWQVNKNLRLKIEPYLQYLYDIPGIADSSFSMVNYKQDLTFREPLENNSSGRNIGIDITLERFLKNNFYYLATVSVFDSKYKAGDHVWRNTRYDKEIVANVLAGKEFFTRKNKNNVLGLNARLNILGGERRTPLLAQASTDNKRPIYDHTKAFEEKDDLCSFLDLTVTYRINKKRHSGIWALQIKNVLGTPQHGEYEFNHKKQQMEMPQDTYTLPVISYKIEF